MPMSRRRSRIPCPCCGGRMIVIETFERGCLAALPAGGIPNRDQDRHIMIRFDSWLHPIAALLLRRLLTGNTNACPRVALDGRLVIRSPLRDAGSAYRERLTGCVTPSIASQTGGQSNRQHTASAEIPIASDAPPRPTSRGFLVWGFFVKEFARAANLCPFSFFVRSQSPFLRPDPGSLTSSRAGAVKVGLSRQLAHAPTLPGHTLTASSTTARWVRSGDDSGGARFRARISRATRVYSVGTRTRTMMQSYASAAKSEAADHSPFRH